jgi:uncharacterized membrane protein YkoI
VEHFREAEFPPQNFATVPWNFADQPPRPKRRTARSVQTARLLMAALAFALLTASAEAQVGGGGGRGRQAHQQPEKSGPQKPKTDDKAYNAALRNIPGKKYDAWHGVR